MWYIIAIEPHGFLNLKVEQGEVDFKYYGNQGGEPKIDVTKGGKYFSIEVFEDSFEPYYLNDFYEINPSGFVPINHTTFLYNWNDGHEKLHEALKSILHTKDNYATFLVSEAIASNFLPIDYLNQHIKK